MKLIVGLGNPGAQYETTRHNVGCMVVRQLGRRHGVHWSLDGQREWTHSRWGSGERLVRLLCPLTMMNQSGVALLGAVTMWRVAFPDILIVCDDVNLPLGALRLRAQGSDGGHHGLASCLELLKTRQIPRLRVGIGIQPLPEDLTDFVLSPFHTSERPRLQQALMRAVEVCKTWATDGIQTAMNRVNRRTTKEGAA